jgi:hypothetical protein
VIPITIGNSTSTTAMNGTCTFGKQISASAGLTSAGDITTSGTATITALSTGSLIGPYKNAATATASITTGGAITGTSLVLGNGNITSCGTITASGLIDANAGVSVAGTLEANSLNGTAINSAQTIGGVITTGSITIGGNLTQGSITLGGVQTTGDINIGTNSTSDIYIGNATNSTSTTDKGTCHINKCQIGSGSIFRSVLFGTVASGSGSATVAFGQTLSSVPIVVCTVNASFTNQLTTITVIATTTGFTYYKNFIQFSGNSITSTGSAGESFNWVAYSA